MDVSMVLIFNKFVFIAVFCYSEYNIASFFGAWRLIIQDAIVEEFMNLVAMGMSVHAELQVGKCFQVKLEYIGYIVVELQVERRHMHHGSGPFDAFG
jgi:hypothetical protein